MFGDPSSDALIFEDRTDAGRRLADKLEPYRAVGLWYRDYGQTTDEEVMALLRKAAEREG